MIKGASLPLIHVALAWLPLTPNPSPKGEGNRSTNTDIATRVSPLAVRISLALVTGPGASRVDAIGNASLSAWL